MPAPRLLAFAQLMRLPNVFTAFADIVLAACVGIALMPDVSREYITTIAILALASGCHYLAGMVWNDVFDMAEDLRDRPFRPLPSGRIFVRTAAVLGGMLSLTGIGLSILGGAAAIGVALAAAVLLYDAWLKRLPMPLGPLGMALCRFLNVLMGLSAIPADVLTDERRIHIAGVIGVYILGVTWFARTEATVSNRWSLRGAASVMVVSLALALVLKARYPDLAGHAMFLFPWLLVAFGFLIGLPVARAIGTPGPKEVQAAIKRCVLGLVVLDAVLATAFVGAPGLLILLLLPPALLMGKWVYST
jgi:hypothetical protein